MELKREKLRNLCIAEKIESILNGIQKISSEITVTVIDYENKVA